MDIQQQNNLEEIRKQILIQQQSPIQKQDFFDELFRNQVQNISIVSQQNGRELNHKHHKRHIKTKDFKKILNSSSSNERLIPSQMKYQSSRQNSQRGRQMIDMQNSLDSQSFRKSFKKRYDQSFSVQNTIRDSSSSFSQRSQRSSVNILPSFYRQQEQMIIQKKLGCNCKRSKCLKLYCQCFQKQQFCNENCNCHDCGNHSQNMTEHKQAIIQALARNAHGFQVDVEEDKKQNNQEKKTFSLGFQIQDVKKGCKCRKTHCIKKYCQCYQNGTACGIFCKCEQCYNNTFSRNQSVPHIEMKKFL